MKELVTPVDLGHGPLQIVQFSDVYGPPPLDGRLHPGIQDADAVLSTIVGNTKQFPDSGEYGISTGLSIGDYLTAFANQLRGAQLETAERFGVGVDTDSEKIQNPLLRTLTESIQRGLVVVTNSAIRDHNGAAEFYVGQTKNGVITISQLAFLRTLHAQRQLNRLYRLPNSFFPLGLQFRSGEVTDALIDGGQLEKIENLDNAGIPTINLPGQIAWVDRFGNVRDLVDDISKVKELLIPGNQVLLKIDGIHELVVEVASSLDTCRLDVLSIYPNPSDPQYPDGPAYFEIARRVSENLLTTPNFAYAALLAAIAKNGRRITPEDWHKISIEVVDSSR